MKTDFWQNIPHSAKYSELREGRHNRLLNEVLYDPNTLISEYDRNSFILYDGRGVEALLYRPHSIIGRIGSRLYLAVVNLIAKDEDVMQ